MNGRTLSPERQPQDGNAYFYRVDEYLNAQFRCVAYNYMGIPFYSILQFLIYKSVVITRQIDDGSPLLGTVCRRRR
ncbi:MAG: hypothetical protein ACLUKN_11170 [Bacilli bacterium]